MGLDRAAKRNAFDLPMWDALCRAYGELERDADAARRRAPRARRPLHRRARSAAVGARVRVGQLAACPTAASIRSACVGPRVRKPVVAAVQGTCLTIGIELMLATDIRIAARDDALRPDRGQARHLPGRRRDAALPARGRLGQRDALAAHRRRVRRGEALRIGLVQEVVEPGEQLARAIALAEIDRRAGAARRLRDARVVARGAAGRRGRRRRRA